MFRIVIFMDAIAIVRRKDAPMSLAALGKFGGFKPEPERQVRPSKVELNQAIEGMMDVWKRFSVTNAYDINGPNAFFYRNIQDQHYSSKDVEAFSLVLSGFQKETYFSFKAGLFLSALMNRCKEDRFVIHTAHLDESIQYIGYYLGQGKMLVVDGDVGDQLGSHLNGGMITINGDAGNFIGKDMFLGSITVMGKAGGGIGERMMGGEIHLNGGYRVIANLFLHGKIFHKEELIVDK